MSGLAERVGRLARAAVGPLIALLVVYGVCLLREILGTPAEALVWAGLGGLIYVVVARGRQPFPGQGLLRRTWWLVRTAAALLLAGLAVYGVCLLHEIIVMPAELLVWAIVGGLLLLWKAVPWGAVVLGAFIVPIVALLGANGLFAQVGVTRPEPLEGLLIAAGFMAVVVVVYLTSWWVRFTPPWPALWVLGVVLPLVILPAAIAHFRNPTKDERRLPRPDPVSQLDVMVVRAGQETPVLRQEGTREGWHIRYVTGRATGLTVQWDGGGAPLPSHKADPVLVLLPESTASEGRLGRWLAIADAAARRDTPTLALLPADDPARLKRWSRELTEDEDRPGKRSGSVHTLNELNESQTIGDLALRLAVTAPTAEADLALAARHRPVILFDHREKYRTPLNVDSLLRSGAMRLCPNDQPGVALLCSEIHDSRDLRNGPNHLEFETGKLAKATEDSIIYVHVTHRETNERKTVYLDYWWYLPDNPSYAADGALCGAGFIIVGVTCFDHQSDWEGITVVLDEEHDPPLPTAAHYAAHDFETRYDWALLRRLWSGPLPRAAAKIDTTERPLVFVANGTHASYPRRCGGSDCKQPDGALEEKRYNGEQGWRGNREDGCMPVCVAALPTHGKRREPARWNAYDGRWGTADCDFLNLCRSSKAPRAPGAQDRYKKPWCADGEGYLARRNRLRRKPLRLCPADPAVSTQAKTEP